MTMMTPFSVPNSSVHFGPISPEFAQAIVKMQGELEGAKKDALNPHFRSKYADLESCWLACRDALQKNSIAVLQWPEPCDAGFVQLRTELLYGPTGEVYGSSYRVPLKSATDAQALGSSVTYARRYALCSVLGICPEDDDGNAAAGAKPRGQALAQRPASSEKQEAGLNAAEYRAKFDGKTDTDGRKEWYRAVKNSSLGEPAKTQLLTYMAEVIKKDKESHNGNA